MLTRRAARGSTMRMNSAQFMRWENKAITLMGMSGVGKTTTANKLPTTNWFIYSGDYRIGTKYLEEPIMDSIKREAMQVPMLGELLRNDSIYIASNITFHNLAPVSSFLGKVGDPAKGGLPLEEFKRRQRLHREAEIAAMRDVVEFIDKAHDIYGYQHLINDAGGSLCELNDPATLQVLAEHTLLIYIEADEHIEQTVVERQQLAPKPLYYQEPFLDQCLEKFMTEQSLDQVEQIDPNKFARWTFPHLLAHRKPLYEAIASQYGYTVKAQAVEQVTDEESFLAMVSACLDAHEAVA